MGAEKNKNIKAIAIGFILILGIGAITYSKSLKKTAPPADNLEKIYADEKNALQGKKITAEELLKKIQAAENIEIIDLRSADEFNKEHILNSKNIPYAEIGKRIAEFNENKVAIFIDDGTTMEAANLAMGFIPKEGSLDVFYLEGGFSGWKNKYNPTISAGDPNSFIDRSKAKYILSDELKETLAAGEDLALLDVRENNEFKDGHLKGAINIPLQDIESKRREIPIGKKIIVYDDDGLDAFRAAVRLFDMGFFNTLTLLDGFNAWKEKGFEIIK